MIQVAIDYVRGEVERSLATPPTVNVVVDSVHKAREEAQPDRVYLTLISVEEEAALRNTDHVVRAANGAPKYKEPPVFLNLYVLLSFSFQDYATSLIRLSETVELFQRKRMFSAENDSTGTFPSSIDRLVFDLHNLSFEQLNHLWSVLGGTYVPSVLYKVRLVKIQADDTLDAPPIRTIKVDTGAS